MQEKDMILSEAGKAHLVLFFTRGMSLRLWEELGLLERELALHRGLLPHLKSLTFVTYGNDDRKYADRLEGIEILCNPGLPAHEYEQTLLDVHADRLAKADLFQSQQIAGSSLVVEAARRFGGVSITRCGYFASQFTREACGEDSAELAAAEQEERTALQNADYVILTTDAARRFAVSAYGIAPDRITLIPNYVRTDVFSPGTPEEIVPGRIVFPGRLNPQKNILALVRALQDVDCELVIASDGELRPEVEALADEVGVKIDIRGFTDNNNIPALFHTADLVALPSHYEGGPPKMAMEAMACGCAVVLGRTPGNDQLLVDGHNALGCSVEVESIRETVNRALADPDLRKRLGGNAREYIVATHGLDVVIPQYITLYDAIFRSREAGARDRALPSLEGMSWSEQAESLADSAIACARGHDPDTALRLLFEIDKRIYREEGFLAIRYDGGVHTKHRHIAYHTYFTERVRPGERVLDVGCGNGLLSMQVAAAGAHVTAMEQHADIVADAKKRHSHERVTFLTGDVLYDLPEEPFDTIILSNILEHIEERVEFLEMLTKRYTPGRFLMRVPRYDRDWRVPLKDEMGVDYFLDPTHYTEYTPEAFERELEQAGLHIVSGETRWGEIWAEVARKETTADRDHGREREGL